MDIKRTARCAAVGAVLAAAMPLSAGTATATSGSVEVWVGPGSGGYGCEFTAAACTLGGYVDDMSTPVTISVDGKALVTGLPTLRPGGAPVGGQLQTTWTPQTAGLHTVSAQQGSQSQTVSIQIVDTNSPQAWIMRLEDYLRQLACQTGSNSGTAGCMTGGIS